MTELKEDIKRILHESLPAEEHIEVIDNISERVEDCCVKWLLENVGKIVGAAISAFDEG
jgi:hypothetical protein